MRPGNGHKQMGAGYGPPHFCCLMSLSLGDKNKLRYHYYYSLISIVMKPYAERTVDTQYRDLLRKILEEGREVHPIQAAP